MSRDKIEKSKEWLASMNEILDRQTDEEKIEYMKERIDVQKWLIEQVELLQQFAEKNTELNVFLEKNSEPKHLGRNVIDVAMDIITEQAERVEELEELQSRKMNLVSTIQNLRNEKRDLQEQNNHYHNLLESISDTHDLAEEIQKENPDIKVITPDDLLQHILRKVNDELELNQNERTTRRTLPQIR